MAPIRPVAEEFFKLISGADPGDDFGRSKSDNWFVFVFNHQHILWGGGGSLAYTNETKVIPGISFSRGWGPMAYSDKKKPLSLVIFQGGLGPCYSPRSAHEYCI